MPPSFRTLWPGHRPRPGMPGALKLMDLPEKLEVLANDLTLIRQFISSRLAL